MTDNLFEHNEPHYSYLDKAKEEELKLHDGKLKQLYITSPYYELLAKEARPISFHDT